MDRTILKTLLLLAPVFVSATVIGGIYGLIGAVIGFIVAFVFCILIIINVDRIILRIYKAHRALKGEISSIEEKIPMLSKRAGVSMPSVHITELPLPSSIIVGTGRDKTALVIPARLLNILDEKEWEALLAYNIAQINNSIHLRTLAALIAALSVTIASAVRWGAVFTGFGDYNDYAPRLFGLFVMGIVAPPTAALIQSITKLDYDNQAVSLCRSPHALISAIERLEKNNITAHSALGFLSLIDPKKEYFFEHLFNTHSLREVRIKNITAKGQIA